MTNADKIRLIASKMLWTNSGPLWRDGSVVMAWSGTDNKGHLFPDGASAVREKLRRDGCHFTLTAWPTESTKAPYEIIVGSLKKMPHIFCESDAEEDATRDAAAQYWSE